MVFRFLFMVPLFLLLDIFFLFESPLWVMQRSRDTFKQLRQEKDRQELGCYGVRRLQVSSRQLSEITSRVWIRYQKYITMLTKIQSNFKSNFLKTFETIHQRWGGEVLLQTSNVKKRQAGGPLIDNLSLMSGPWDQWD